MRKYSTIYPVSKKRDDWEVLTLSEALDADKEKNICGLVYYIPWDAKMGGL